MGRGSGIKCAIKNTSQKEVNNIKLNPMEIALQERKENIYLSNRKNDIKQKLKLRRNMLINSLDQHLTSLIHQSDIQCTPDIFMELIFQANRNEQNAMKQLGNLIIDDRSRAQRVSESIEPFSCDGWWWLLLVLVTSGYITKLQFNLLMRKLSDSNSSHQSRVWAIQTCVQLTNKPQLCSLLLVQKGAVESIVKMMEEPCQELHKPAFRVFSNLVSNSQAETAEVITRVRPKIPLLMKIGLLKADLSIRLDTCQSLSNLALNRFLCFEVLDLIMLRALNDSSRVKSQLSYYFAAVAKVGTTQQLQYLISKDVISALQNYIGSSDAQVVKNGCQFVQATIQCFERNQSEREYLGFIRLLQSYSLTEELIEHMEQNNMGQHFFRAIQHTHS